MNAVQTLPAVAVSGISVIAGDRTLRIQALKHGKGENV